MTDSKWAILLDLDQTLVLTNALLDLRRRREWQQIYRSFHLTSQPPGTQQFIQIVRKLGDTGIITTSPRPYAEKLVAYHQLNIPVVIAYHDVRNRKPHPESILKAAELLHVSQHRCIYVGDMGDDIMAAVNAGAIPIGLSWDGTLEQQREAKLARALCKNWDEVLTFIARTINSIQE
jgi:HAD superfamily hydrolase (TIGR01549 family)